MRLQRASKGIRRVLTALLGLACLPAAGCFYGSPARLWADTALPDGTMSLQRHQWAYDGETVTFDLECDPGAGVYAVFGVSGEDTVVDTGKADGHYRWTHVFHTGVKPTTCVVYAMPFVVRGLRDWVFDKTEEKWYFYPSRSDKGDVQIGGEQRMKITCYRADIRMPVKARGGPPKGLELSLTKATGERRVIPARPPGAGGDRGFLLAGPDPSGSYEVSYTPTCEEVGRAGKTHVELVVEHADGSVERLQKDIDTP